MRVRGHSSTSQVLDPMKGAYQSVSVSRPHKTVGNNFPSSASSHWRTHRAEGLEMHWLIQLDRFTHANDHRFRPVGRLTCPWLI